MTQPFMKAYVDRLIQTCHRRGAHAMGGMAAQIPIKNDPVRTTTPAPTSLLALTNALLVSRVWRRACRACRVVRVVCSKRMRKR
jgi:hypothetical protein